MADAWGIPGPLFLAIYSAAVLAVLYFTIRHRRDVFRGEESRLSDQLPPAYLGLLAVGPVRAVQASLAWLRYSKLLALSGNRFSRSGSSPRQVRLIWTVPYSAAP